MTLSYKFNATKSKYKGTGAGQSEKNRLWEKGCKQPSQVSPDRNSLTHSVPVWNLGLSPGFTKFHTPLPLSKEENINQAILRVKLGETSVKAKVSHGGIVSQTVMHRWNLWRLFAKLFKMKALKIRLREIKKRLDVRSNSSSTFKNSSSTVAQLLKKREAKKLFENKSKYSSETVPDYPSRLY